jgi:hypothetical protein
MKLRQDKAEIIASRVALGGAANAAAYVDPLSDLPY